MSVVRSYGVSMAYKTFVDRLRARVDEGDEDAALTLAAMALLISGWRYGDPDPVSPDDGDDGEAVTIDQYYDAVLEAA